MSPNHPKPAISNLTLPKVVNVPPASETLKSIAAIASEDSNPDSEDEDEFET
jgi:hypothetical protein